MSQVPAKHYIITRADLPSGLQAAQCCHAAIDFALKYPEITKHWHDTSNFIVLLAAPNEESLDLIRTVLENRGVKICIFYEPDLGNQLTAIATEPSEVAGKLLSNLPLALRSKGLVKRKPSLQIA